MMVAGKYKMLIEQGATFSLPLHIDDDGVDRDLSGYTARLEIKETIDDADPLLTMTTENGRIIIAPDQVANTGDLTLFIAAADTELLDFTTGVYDLELVIGDVVERVLEGKVKLSREVTT
jgi:hypothetical protein